MKLLKKILPVFIAVIIIYAVFLLVSDLDKITDKIINFKLEYVPIVISLVVFSWFIVYWRWNLLLKNLGIIIPHKINFQIFLVGGALGITPGKVGELFKSQILKDKFDIPRSKTAPLFIIEKFFDIIGALIVTSFGIWFIPELGFLSIAALPLLFLIFKILVSKKLFDKTLIFFSRLNFLKKYLEPLSSSHEILTDSLQKKNMLIFSSLSIFYWITIGIAAFFVVQGFGISSISIINMISTYSGSLIIGALSFIPGGVGVAEGSLIGLFSAQNIDLSEAIVIVVLIRLFTLWFSTIAGFVALKTSKTF
tara:strand:- start:17302 stop:18225 length:924 start_codon:yes stop_codon:yes gene_type:complete